MPKIAKQLSAVEVKRLKQKGRYPVGGVSGLLLNVSESGARSWILRTKVGDRRREIGLGSYPAVTLARARDRARQEKEDIQTLGIDPVVRKIEIRQEIRRKQFEEKARLVTFEKAAIDCHAARVHEFRNAHHKKDWIRSLEMYAFPVIGKMSVADIELEHVLKVLEPYWLTKTETMNRTRQRMEAVLDWSIVRKYRTGDNPARWKGNLDSQLAKPKRVNRRQHFRTIPWQEMPAFMEKLREQPGTAPAALRFKILTATRSGEVRYAKWNEVDMEAKVWTVPPERTKTHKRHRVPLSKEAIEILKSQPKDTPFVFMSPRGKALSDMALLKVVKRMKVDAVPHALARSTFRDWCAESTNYPREVAEQALAHKIDSDVEAAYRRGDLLEKRARLMRDWYSFLKTPRSKAEVTQILRAK